MKKLVFKNSFYQYLEEAYRKWLDILGYCKESTDHMLAIIREFMHYLETNKITRITELQCTHYKSYFNHISSRSNLRRGGGLSNNYLNKHIQSLEKFYEFLTHNGTTGIPSVNLRQLKLEKGNITVLTREEVQQLYKATEQETDYPKQEAFNARDRALLTVFYGCGSAAPELVGPGFGVEANLTIPSKEGDFEFKNVPKFLQEVIDPEGDFGGGLTVSFGPTIGASVYAEGVYTDFFGSFNIFEEYEKLKPTLEELYNKLDDDFRESIGLDDFIQQTEEFIRSNLRENDTNEEKEP